MKNVLKRVNAGLLCLLLGAMLVGPVPARAAAAIDVQRGVSLTLHCVYGDAPLEGVSLRLFRVAEVSAYGSFTLTEEFAAYPVSLEGLGEEQWLALAETLAGYVRRDEPAAQAAGKTGDGGTLRLPEQAGRLEPGLYLVMADRLRQGSYTYTAAPFLISLPQLDGEKNIWSYDPAAAPKFERSRASDGGGGGSSATLERKVLKVWQDQGGQDGRPDSVVADLLKNGEVYDTVTLNRENSWRHTWRSLPKYDASGSPIDWQVAERRVEGYTVTTTLEGITFVITNTLTQDPPEIPENPDGPGTPESPEQPGVPEEPSGPRQSGTPALPQTGLLWWPVPLLAAAGLACVAAGILSGKKRRHE